MSDLELARLCLDAYSAIPTYDVHGLEVRATAGPAAWGDADVLAFRGTDSVIDWIRDAAWRPFRDRDLGWCHGGFLLGSAAVDARIEYGARPLVLAGHSLGGAVALALGARLAARGRPPALLVTFGAPRVGMGKYAALLAGVPVRQYRRGNDPVTQFPFAIPPLLRFQHAREPLILIGEPSDRPFDCHRMAGYLADLANLAGAPAAT